jgi:hypothetical protein
VIHERVKKVQVECLLYLEPSKTAADHGSAVAIYGLIMILCPINFFTGRLIMPSERVEVAC